MIYGIRELCVINIPPDLNVRFDAMLAKKAIKPAEHIYFRKWLRYYLDFCSKYRLDRLKRESLPHFIKKLQEKHQTQEQQRQASYAVSLYYGMFISDSKKEIHGKDNARSEGIAALSSQSKNKVEESAFGKSWKSAYDALHSEI
jgi:hypothetical protein